MKWNSNDDWHSPPPEVSGRIGCFLGILGVLLSIAILAVGGFWLYRHLNWK